MSDVTDFPRVRAKRPAVKGSGDNLASIAAPEVIEGNIEGQIIAALTLSLTTFGSEKTTEIMLRAFKAARGRVG